MKKQIAVTAVMAAFLALPLLAAPPSRQVEKRSDAVKGGSWKSKRTGCRTEAREEGRAPNLSYDSVGFRIVREK